MTNNQPQQNQNNPIVYSSANPSTGGYITLPVPPDQFNEFIINLLGRPQSIEKRIYGRFEIEWSDITNFNDLINQRIIQQNKAQLINFQSRIYFHDNSVIELNSYPELITYKEVRPLVTVAIDLSWDYLIQFNNKQSPEKQSIDIRLWTDKGVKTRRYTNKSNEDTRIIIGDSEDESYIEFAIKHTARSWGLDIESLLYNQIKILLKPEQGLKKFIRKYNAWIGFISGILFFILSFIGTYIVTNIFINSILFKIKNILNNTKELGNKINILAEYIVNGETTKFYFLVGIFLLFSFFASIIVIIVIASNANNIKPSFFLFTNKDVAYRESRLLKLKAQWRNFIFSVIGSYTINILSSYIFAYLTR
ncbi:hypothetical protein [uncultured Nostoc sp.]|uniref:hypothetical protein n=1 Tax=uncultured Nostoc sp. TaxID=340711 RepID=UPI0035CA0F7D